MDVRSELDLRIGAAFTRFQTLRLTKVFPTKLNDMLISYGSYQFPTLGFGVERFLAIERFVSKPYWKIKVCDNHDNINVEFRWGRNRLFEELPCQIFLDTCLEQRHATVEKVTRKPKSKWRSLPLDTVVSSQRVPHKKEKASLPFLINAHEKKNCLNVLILFSGTREAGIAKAPPQRQRDDESRRKIVYSRIHKLSAYRDEYISERIGLAPLVQQKSSMMK